MNELQQVKYNGDLILTTEQLADFYETTVNRIIDNFHENKDKFLEGKHYYILQGNKLKEFKRVIGNSDKPLINKYTSQLVLWTRQGASRHSKMLGTDKAWDMFDVLEENYFNPQQVKIPTTPRELARLALEVNEETNVRIDSVEKDIKELRDDWVLTPGEYNYIGKRASRQVNEYAKVHSFITNSKQRSLLFKDINRSINEVAGTKTRSQLRAKDFNMVDELITDWQPSVSTVQIIKRMSDEADGQMNLDVDDKEEE
ncbi:hypothetical protein C5Z25_12030 [Lactobacillus sp. CBA3605]|uniref:ORF6N domain-containing protein n=1 Tax=Lactobacillus sp. CBA3605 TaxID=2099788 RepID=UPI000CFB8CED|nr:ORF6N domain-containing protein [Lactobacillus sp. CBA3605]AVK62442.1 hypothetical protein C5Z25_12030 [Lactobacillus sp. CBA3605]